MPLKRKFAFNLTPIKTTLGLDKSDKSDKADKSEKSDKPKHHSGFLHSPFFNPPSPVFERPVISAQQEAELRNTLIKVLRDINKPSEQVYEEMFWKRKSSKPVVDEKASEDKAKDTSRPAHKKNPSFTVSGPHDASKLDTGAKRYDSGIAVEPELGVSRTSTAKDESQRHSKAGLSIRPVVSADNSTVATEATRDVEASAGSTGLTSAALTPGDAGKSNVFAQGFSKSEPLSATDTSDAQNWMAQEFAKRKSQNIAAPAPASSAQPPSSATALTPTAAESPSAKNDSKRRNTVAQTNPAASDHLTAPSQDQDAKITTPNDGKKVSWWRRASMSRRKSSASLKPHQSAGDTPATKSGGRTPKPTFVVPPLPRLDSAKWSEKAAKTEEKEEKEQKEKKVESSPKDVASSPIAPPLKAPLSPVEEPDEPKRPGSAIIIDGEGKERELSIHEERKRDSDIQSAVKAKMLAGSLSSTPSTPALSAVDKKSLEFSRPNSQRSTSSAVKVSSPLQESTESPSPDKTEVAPTPKAADPPAPVPKVDSKLSSPVDSAPATKGSTRTVSKINTITTVNLPKTQVESATPITPAIEELEDPYGLNPLGHAKTSSPIEVKKSQSRGSTFMKRFSSLRSAPPKNNPISPVTPSKKELQNQRAAKMKAYGKILETQYEKPDSSHNEHSRTSRLLDSKPNPIRSASPTPSDLYAL